jgi:hypothetical protein
MKRIYILAELCVFLSKEYGTAQTEGRNAKGSAGSRDVNIIRRFP